MEGLSNGSGGGNAKFLQIFSGKIAMNVDANTPNAKQRTNKKDKVVYELHWDYITGKVTKFEIRDTDFGEQLSITITLPTTQYILNIPVESRYFDAFAKSFRNINFEAEVRFAPYSFKDKNDPNKTISGMNILQEALNGWEKVDWYYTKETPNGMPVSPDNLPKDEFKIHILHVGLFLKKQIKEFVMPGQTNVSQHTQNTHSNSSSNSLNNGGTGMMPIEDDLPF